jgi:hypothetical protein
MQSARIAETPDVLDRLQAEVDAILASTIREVETNAMEDRALAAFSLALDQVRLAITDRRNMLVKLAA